ncbi:MAG: TlpA family protein disulfide reductase [Algoriphagus sp.]|uniref:TlpA family protein disulfide reductase n=1 Tax=Algoriphagus sp. TaxID=1872435 RepID=UPI00179D38D6|nr:TlpA disulfide reductase family protein [Algoriphagus sp.]NVJ86687.1 TlpA family protein disulfide reductase [Algoriphagus sp.]
MKTYLKPLATGIGITLILIFVMLKITMNFQILLFLGAGTFFAAGIIHSESKRHFLLTTVLIAIAFNTFFVLIVLKELPVLWYFVPVYFVSCLFGVLVRKYKQPIIILSGILAVGMLFLVIQVIPNSLESSLSKERFDKLPEFTMEDVNGNLTDSKSLAGKIIVLDFFGTWCKPCIQELKELDKIKAYFEGADVVFYIINADQGNDTPEKFEAFIKKNNYTFNYVYDHESKIFKQLKMSHFGLPTLLIIDKNQNIRLQHVGYNTAEINFREHIINTINNLK